MTIGKVALSDKKCFKYTVMSIRLLYFFWVPMHHKTVVRQ